MDETDRAAALRGYGPQGTLAFVVILLGALAGGLVAGALVLAWAWLSRTSPRALGLAAPRHVAGTMLVGLVAGAALKLFSKAIVMPLLGAPAINATYHWLVGNTAALPGMIATILFSAGLGEEIFYRGFLFERSRRAFGDGAAARVLTVLITTTLFALAHVPEQGWPGAEQAALSGLVLGSLYAWRRNLLLPIVMHISYDLVAIAIIHGNLETRIAHSVFH